MSAKTWSNNYRCCSFKIKCIAIITFKLIYTNDYHYPIVELLSVQDDMTLLELKHLYGK